MNQSRWLLAGALTAVLTGPAEALAGQSGPPGPAVSQSATAEPINADRPGIADGSSVIGHGQIQLEIGTQLDFSRTTSSYSRTLFFPTLLRVGLDGRWELRFETNAYARSTATSGFNPISVGFKWTTKAWTGNHAGSIGVIARAFPASGSRDFRSSRTTADVRLAADLAITSTLSLNPNIGLARAEDNGHVFLAGLAALTLSYAPSDRWNPFVDVGYQQPVEIGGTGSLILDGGLGYILGRNVQLDVSVGSSVNQSAPRPFVSFGFSRRWR